LNDSHKKKFTLINKQETYTKSQKWLQPQFGVVNHHLVLVACVSYPRRGGLVQKKMNKTKRKEKEKPLKTHLPQPQLHPGAGGDEAVQ
jgi:hypothetical protein